MQTSSKATILRMLIVLTILAQAITIAASFLLKNTLPAELAQFVRARDFVDLSGREAVALLPSLLVTGGLLVGLIGLWWRKRWARLLFTIAAVLIPPLVTDGLEGRSMGNRNTVTHIVNLLGLAMALTCSTALWNKAHSAEAKTAPSTAQQKPPGAVSSGAILAYDNAFIYSRREEEW
jgi:hypothetical protein